METAELPPRVLLDVRRLGTAFRRYWWCIVIFAVVGAAGGFAYSAGRGTQYSASASVQAGYSTSNAVLSLNLPQFSDTATLQATEAGVLQSQSFRDQVTHELGHRPTIVVSSLSNSALISVTATASSPKRAATDANTYVRTFLAVRAGQVRTSLQALASHLSQLVAQQAQRLSRAKHSPSNPLVASTRQQLSRNSTLLASVNAAMAASVSDASEGAPAVAPSTANGLSTGSLVVLGLLLFGLVGVLISLLLLATAKTFWTVDEAASETNLPIIGRLTHDGGADSDVPAAANAIAALTARFDAGANVVLTGWLDDLALESAAKILTVAEESRVVAEAVHGPNPSVRREPPSRTVPRFAFTATGPFDVDPRAAGSSTWGDGTLLVVPSARINRRQLAHDANGWANLGCPVVGLIAVTPNGGRNRRARR